MIDRADVIQVADSIGISLTDKQIDAILATYPDNWTLIVEDMIYDIKDVMKQIPE